MSAQPQEQFLRVGDNIFLFDDESRALTTENPIDTRVLAKTAQGSDTFPREAVGCSIFRIEPQQSFTARKELLKAVNISSTSVAEFSDADTSDYNNPGNCAELQPDNLPSASWLNAATSNATTVEEVHELEDLRNLAAKEHAQNEAERRRLHGKPVLYGQMIRLYNAHFRKYVSVNPAKSCELATGHLRVDLTREPGGYFRIMPRFKIRVEGEPVRLGDTVALQSVRPEGYLNIGKHPLHSDVYSINYYEVFTHTRMASWTIRRHSSTTLPSHSADGTAVNGESGVLKAGQFVRMYHKELEGYTECHVGETSVHLRRHVLNPLDPKESNSPIAFWQIELEDPLKGSTIRWRKRCRIKHVASRAYLYIDPNNVTVRADTDTVGFHLGLTASASFLVSNDPTLFELAPVASTGTESDASHGIPFGSYARIRHVLTKCWLHATSDGFTSLNAKPTGVTASAYSPTSSPRLERKHRFRAVDLQGQPSIQQLSEGGQHVRQDDIVASLTASPELHYHDCFSLTQVQPQFVDTFNRINEMVPRLHWFLKKTRKAGLVAGTEEGQAEGNGVSKFPIGELEAKSVAEILTALINFCTKSPERDPLKRKRIGLPIEYHQTVLRDVGIIQLIVNILQIPFDLQKRASVRAALVSFNTKRTLRPPFRATSSPSSDEEEAVSFDDIATGREPRLQYILCLCHALLEVFMLGGGLYEHDTHQQQNQLHVFKLAGGSLDLFISRLGCGVGPARMLVRLLGGNSKIMETVAASREQVIGRLVAFLQEHIGPVMATRKDEPSTAKRVDDDEVAAVVDVLSALCYVTGAGPITGNQDYIAGQLLRDGEDSNILVHTRVAWEKHSVTGGDANGDAGRVVSAGHNVAQLKIPRGAWLSLERFVDEETKEATVVLESILGLLEAICLGKNLKSIELVRQSWVGQDVCLNSLMDPLLPMDLRANFCNLLRVLYVDTPPFKPILFSDFTFPSEGLAKSTELPWDGVEGNDRTPSFFEDLQRWILQFLDENSRQLTEAHGTNILMSSVLKLVHEQIKLGFYSIFAEIRKLVAALLRVLDGRTDARNAQHVKFLDEPSNDNLLWRQRFELTEQNCPVMETKIQILEILDTLFNLRLRVRVRNLAVEWQQLENPKEKNVMPVATLSLTRLLIRIFRETNLLNREDVLMPILKDLLKYQYAPLKRAAIVVMHRVYNDCEDIFMKAQKSLLLSSTQQVLAYHGIKKRLAEFRSLNARGIVDIADVPMIIKHVNEFTQLCKDNVSIGLDDQIVRVFDRGLRDSHKRIFKNLNTHNVIVHLMTSLNNIKANEDDDVDLSFDWEQNEDATVKAIAACMVFLEELCVGDKDLQDTFVLDHFDLLIAVTAYRPPMVSSLIRMCSDNLHICVRVREHHLQRILELSEGRYAQYLRLLHVLVKASGKLVKRNQDIIVRLIMEHQGFYVISGEDLSTPQKLEYYSELIDLLAVCTEGENQTGQSFCRTILSIKSIASSVLDPSTSYVLKCALLRFLVSVYLWITEATSNVILHDNPSIMRLLDNSRIELEAARDRKEGWDNSHMKYIFDGITIFLRVFFEFHITAETTAEGDLRTLCNTLVDDSIALLQFTNGDPKNLRHLWGAMDAMINISGFTGSVEPRQLKEKLRIAQIWPSPTGQRPVKTVGNDNVKFQGFLRTLMVHRDVLDLQTEEFKKLSSHFRLTDVKSEEDIKSLIDHLSGSTTATNRVTKMTESFETKTIKILENIPGEFIHERSNMKSHDLKSHATLEEKKEAVQNTLNRLGCTLMAQTLLSSPYQSVFDSALKLLIVLLDGGNRNVQDVLENYFLSIREERFFYCMHSRIQSGISSLEEAQHLLIREAQKQERQNFVVTAEPAHPTETSSPRIRHHRTHKPHRVSFSTGRELLRHASYANLMEPKKRWSIHGTPPESTALTQLSAMNETAEFGTAKEDFEVMKDIMRLLQLMVEGHNSHLQSYLRLQPDNIKSFDIVKDTVEYLHAIIPIANIQNLRLIIQVLDTITETAQGCLDNQVTIFNNKIVNPINSILRDSYPNCPSTLVSELKSKAIICLLSLLEGGLEGSDHIFKEMASTLDLTIVDNMTSIYEHNKDDLDKPGVYQRLEGGFLYCMLVMTLFPAFDEDQQAMFQNNPAFEFFKKNTGKIEIILDKGAEKQLSRVLFPIPEICKYLRPETKELFLWSVKRDSPSAKIEDFVIKSENIIFEIENQARIVENPYLSILASYSSLWWQAAYGVTFALNLVILFCSTTSVDSPWSLQTTPECGSFDDALRILLGLLHVSLWGLSTAEFTLIQLPVLVNRSLSDKKAKGEDSDEKNILDVFDDFVFRDAAMTAMIVAALTDRIFLYHAAMLVFSFMGFIYPSFYAIHLLDYVFRDRILQGVISSVTMNVTPLSRTVVLGIVLVYIHSLIAFMFFRNDFDVSKGLHCDSVLQCFVTVLSHGVRAGGGIGDILEPPADGQPFGWRVLFEMSFFLIVVIFLLNVIFGIIFDTFGQLRADRSTVQQDMNNACFICSIEAAEFQRHAKKGFEAHIKEDHNIWQYLFFLLHLKLKDVTEYTSQESYVADCLKQADYGFFPVHRALCLKKDDVNDEEKLVRIEEILGSLAKRLKKIEGSMEMIVEANRTLPRSALLSPS